MKSNKLKIYVVLCSTMPGITDQVSFLAWCDQLIECRVLADLEPIFLFGDHSAQRTINDWLQIVNLIKDRQGPKTGFIILHGLDNMLSASTLTAFSLGTSLSPVIFTGGDALTDPLLATNLRSMLVNGVQLATSGFSDVSLLFGNRLLRAALSRPDSAPNVFDTPESGILGRVDFSIRVFPTVTPIPKTITHPVVQSTKHIATLSAQPFLTSGDIVSAAAHAAAVVINAGTYHQLPTTLVRAITEAQVSVPLVVWAPQTTGEDAPSTSILVRRLTWESTVAKLWRILETTTDLAHVKKELAKNLIGEILPE